MYDKAWVTNASAILTMMAAVAGGASGQVSYEEAVAAFLAAGGLLGLGRKLESIRQGIAQAGKVAEANKPD